MADGLPWFPFYAEDFLHGTSALTNAEAGVYIRMLALMWERQGPLPGDNYARLARRIGGNAGSLKRIVDLLEEEGKIHRDIEGNWMNKRLMQEMQKSATKTRNRSKGQLKTKKKSGSASDNIVTVKPQSGDDIIIDGAGEISQQNQLPLEAASRAPARDNPHTPEVSASSPSGGGAKKKRGTRISPDWVPGDAEKLDATTLGMTTEEIEREADRFRDYWLGRTGQIAVKLDWRATWRNWCRKHVDDRKHRRGGPAPQTSGRERSSSNAAGYVASRVHKTR